MSKSVAAGDDLTHNKLNEPDKGNEYPAMMETVVLDCDRGGGSDSGVAEKIGGATTGASSCSSSVSRPPPPFLRKIYNILENDEIKSDLVSWSSKGTSFVIRNHRLFSANVLPLYFKHCNFQSFIRQLNEYGFKKICWENKWKFKNEHFRKGEWHLLKNIKRRNQLAKNDEHVLDETQTSIDNMSSCSNKDEEFKILMNEHELLKMEILNTEGRQHILQKRVESLKNQVLSNEQENQKIIMSVVKMISSRQMNSEAETATEGSINGKRKLEEMEKPNKSTPGSEVGSCSAIPGHDDAATNDSELSFEKFNRHEKILSVEDVVGGHDRSQTKILLENLIRKPFDEWADYINEGISGGIWP